jgi:hypothetical protein
MHRCRKSPSLRQSVRIRAVPDLCVHMSASGARRSITCARFEAAPGAFQGESATLSIVIMDMSTAMVLACWLVSRKVCDEWPERVAG